MPKRKYIELRPLHSEIVTPERYVQIFERERDNIESVKVIPGTLGSKDFGKFYVQRKRPVYVPSLDDALVR